MESAHTTLMISYGVFFIKNLLNAEKELNKEAYTRQKVCSISRACWYFNGRSIEKAQIPEDLFNHKSPSLTIQVYFRPIDAIQSLAVDENTPLKMGDAEKQFVSLNDTMWDCFEPELNRCISEMEVNDTFSVSFRSILIELLPSGVSEVEDVHGN